MSFAFTFVAAGPLQRYAQATYSGANIWNPLAPPGSEYTIGATELYEEGFPFSLCANTTIDPTRTASVPFGFGFSITNPFQPASVASWCFGDGPKNVVLSDEYTADLLRTYTLAALPPFDGDWNDTPGSHRDLSTNGLTLTVRDARYQWAVPPHRVGSGRSYWVRWKERFTPSAGGAAVDLERCAKWDGVLPEGYDPEDDDTWPVLKNGELDYWELPPPEANGSVAVVEIEWGCQGSAEACP